MPAAGRRIEANPIANSYVLDARADAGNDSGAIGAKNMRHCYAHASDAQPIPNIYMIERRGAEFHDGLRRAVESRLFCILKKQLVDAAMAGSTMSKEMSSRRRPSPRAAIFGINSGTPLIQLARQTASFTLISARPQRCRYCPITSGHGCRSNIRT